MQALRAAVHAASQYARVHMKGRGLIWFHTHSKEVASIIHACGFTATAPVEAAHMIFQSDFDPDIISP